MRIFVLALAIMAVYAQELLVTQEYTDYLKKHVDWEVVDYEENIFRGWTIDEAKTLLNDVDLEQDDYYDDSYEIDDNAPSSIDWSGANCDCGVRNRDQCAGAWAYTIIEMLQTRCCLQQGSFRLLSIQELISCDAKNKGCQGGWPSWALDYIIKNKGLVHEKCFPYVGRNVPCTKKCADGKDWKSSHICGCTLGYKTCTTVDCFKNAIKSGPVTVGFGICRSFFNFKSGIYKCDCGKKYVGLHVVVIMGIKTDPECHYILKNSWGSTWGEKGYFRMACTTCGIPGDYPNGNVYCPEVK